MPARHPLSTLAVILAVATLLAACSKETKPAASGVSTATPTAAATATATPSPSPAPALAPAALEAMLMKALLQRGDVPGSTWVIQDVGMKDVADLTKSSSAQGSAQLTQDFQTACVPGQAASAPAGPVEGVMRVFALPPDGLNSVVSLAMRTADAQKQVTASRATKIESIRDCLQREMQKAIAAQVPGATVTLVEAKSSAGLPDHGAGSELVARIAAGGGLVVTQRIGTVSFARGDIIVTNVMVTMSDRDTAAPFPLSMNDLATISAKRLAEAVR